MTTLGKFLPLIVLALFLTACAGQQKELLEKDYLPMNNAELLTYYDNLSAEIIRCDRERNRTSVGVGTGIGSGRGFGMFLGLSQGISGCNPDKLRLRRNEVWIEMNRRGLKTPGAPTGE